MINLLQRSSRFALDHWWVFKSISLTYIVLLVSPELTKPLLQNFGVTEAAGAAILGGAFGLVTILLDLGLVDFTLRSLRKERVSILRCLFFSRHILAIVGIMLCIALPIFFLGLAILKYAAYLLPIFAILPAILIVRTTFWRVILVEEGCGVWQSLLRSWKRTKGKFLFSLQTTILVFIFEILGFVLLLIGALFFLPFSSHFLVASYRKIHCPA